MIDIHEQLSRIPLFAGKTSQDYRYQRLGGLTNLVYRVELGGGQYLLRIPGTGTGDYIDRRVEAHDARVAAAAGVSAEVLFFDENDGLMLARYIDGLTMNAEHFKALDRVGRAALAFRRLHRCGQAFKTRFELFAKIDEYLALINQLDAPIPEGYEQVKSEAQAVRRALEKQPTALAPCHCDPLAENFIDTGSHMLIVDWEYAGMNDPMWDLGDLSVEAEFGPEQDRALMRAYFDGEPPPDQLGRMVMYKAMCDLLWTLWGVIQHANGNPADDFWTYSVNRFERCQALMNRPEFAEHLRAVETG